MPADPSEYTILRNLQDALKLITLAGGYHYAVAAAAVKLDPNQSVEALIAPGGPRPFIVLEVLPTEWRYLKSNRVTLTMKTTVHWVSESTSTDDENRIKVFMRGCADVEKAIAADFTRGGLVTDTLVKKCEFDTVMDGAQVWAMVDVEMNFQRVYGQPNG